MASVASRLVLAGALCALYGVAALDVQRLQLPTSRFDPSHPQVQQSLQQALGLAAVRVTSMVDNLGSNGGVWILSDSQGRAPDMVIKSRPPAPPLAPEFLPEPEHYMKLARDVPSLMHDPSVVFPSKILACYDPSGAKVTDLIVMRKAPGTILGTYIAEMSVAGECGRRDLNAMFGRVGQQLRAFHDAYGMQHTDFQTSNVMVDKDDGTITFLDLGGMGQPTCEGDLAHMQGTLCMIAPLYAPGLLDDANGHFNTGYHSVRPRDIFPVYADKDKVMQIDAKSEVMQIDAKSEVMQIEAKSSWCLSSLLTGVGAPWKAVAGAGGAWLAPIAYAKFAS